MAIIETSWKADNKDLRLFGTIGAVLFGAIGLGALLKIGFLVAYPGKLLSWWVMAILAVLCAVSLSMVGKKKKVPEEMRPYATAGIVVFAVLAVAFKFNWLPMATMGTGMMLAIAAFFLVGGYVLPDLLRPVYFTLLVATFPLGLVMGPVVLGIMFYGVFTPVAFIFKLIGRDPMTRKFDPNAQTYWVEHDPAASAKRYFKQF